MKILFIKKAIGDTEWNLFTKLAGWITEFTPHTAYTYDWRGDLPVTDPDVMVHLHGVTPDNQLKKMGITNKPKRVCYLMGQCRPAGWAVWGSEFEEFSDAIWGYGIMNQQKYCEVHTITFAPLPIDIEEIPQAEMDTSGGIKFVRMAKRTDMIGRMWHNTLHAKIVLKELGYDLTLISDMKREDALRELTKYHVFIGNFGGRALGKQELEAMTAGLCCIGDLDDLVKDMYETLGANFPYIQTLKATFRQDIQNIGNVKEKGQACRNWMLTNYSHKKLAQYWARKLEAL